MANNEVTFKELEAILKELPEKIRNKELTVAVRAGANHIKKIAVRNAKKIDDPKTPQKIWKQITVRKGRSRSRNILNYRIGVKGGAKMPEKGIDWRKDETNVWYFRYVEFGTKRAKAKPFLQPAIKEAEAQVLDIVSKKLADRIQKMRLK